MTLSQAQARLSKVANMIPEISGQLEIGEDETRESIIAAMAYLNSILKAVDGEKIDYTQ